MGLPLTRESLINELHNSIKGPNFLSKLRCDLRSLVMRLMHTDVWWRI